MKHYPRGLYLPASATLCAAGLALSLAVVPALASPQTLVRTRSVVSVTVPPLVTGPTDGLPSTLARNKSYVVAVRGMATAGTGGATMTVTGTGVTLTACSARLSEITPYTLKCALRVNPTANRVVINVAAKGTGFFAKFASFAHTAK